MWHMRRALRMQGRKAGRNRCTATLAAGAAGCAAAIYGICKFGEKHIAPHAANVFNKFCNWVGNLKGKKTVEAEAEEVQEDESEE